MEYKSEATGASIVINPCSLIEAFKLKSKIQKALLDKGMNIEKLMEQDIFSIVCALDSDEDVFACMFECLKQSQYNGVGIKPDVFDDVKAREDIYDIFFNCLKVNLYPFFKKILSKLEIQLKPEDLKGSLKQTLKTNLDSSAALSQSKGISAETQTK